MSDRLAAASLQAAVQQGATTATTASEKVETKCALIN